MGPESDHETPFLDMLRSKNLTLRREFLDLFEIGRVQAYYEFLKTNNASGGFFSKRDAGRILERHIYENMIFSYYVSLLLNVTQKTELADAGSGPGLPGFFFACLKKPPQLTLIDSSQRRLGRLEEFHNASNRFPSVRFRYERLEDCTGEYDIIVMRALIPYPYCIELVCGLQRPGGWIALADTTPDDKAPLIQDRLQRLGYVSRETIHPPEIQFLGSRCINLLLKTRETEMGYPRKWKLIKKELLQWEK